MNLNFCKDYWLVFQTLQTTVSKEWHHILQFHSICKYYFNVLKGRNFYNSIHKSWPLIRTFQLPIGYFRIYLFFNLFEFLNFVTVFVRHHLYIFTESIKSNFFRPNLRTRRLRRTRKNENLPIRKTKGNLEVIFWILKSFQNLPFLH